MLNGKRSSQTIQDGHLYQCLFLFGILPRLKRACLEQHLDVLLNHHYIKKEKEMTYKITKKGEKILSRQLEKHNFIFYLNGWKYKDVSYVFWSRLVLTVQSLSCITGKNHHFFPVIKDQQVKLWVKQTFPKQNDRDHFNNQLYAEVLKLLTTISKLEAEIFTYKLSGWHRIGQTDEQLASYFGIERTAIELIHLSVVHRILNDLTLNQKKYPLLRRFIMDLNRTVHMTHSTNQTYQLIKQGLSIDEIASSRQLKKSTIEDHIVEITLEDKTVELTPFVTSEEKEKITEVIQTTRNLKLSYIKSQLSQDISYFKIRLVLAHLTNSK
ncbi:helix-turn-helix domain-containing protein [Alkalihalobacterium alkalinitrilicum]|uniref:helix-turn-helix domain-containing protein n=1 Tax=Alkalihalobacterium alkalinitrilicum TaxID=427920 RepID=UPI000995B689|nr:helix-turn-helix domain-containing protein [Alkalihalobacterium alkalinitrilicum]